MGLLDGLPGRFARPHATRVRTRAAQWANVYANWRFISLISINKNVVALVHCSNVGGALASVR
jgi:hypothetical protein